MDLYYLRKLYLDAPLWTKKIYASIPPVIRLGYQYFKYRKRIKKNYRFNPSISDISELTKKFNFYSLFYDKELNDWESIPLIDKKISQEYFYSLKKSRFDFIAITGGVTGSPAKFLQTRKVWSKEQAFVHDFFARHGCSHRTLRACFRGGDFSRLDKDVYWIENPLNNEIQFSPFHLSPDTAIEYVNELVDRKIEYLHGYPSVFIQFASYILKENIVLKTKMKCIFLVSEGFSKNEYMLLKNVFNCEIASFYGHSERLIFGEFCEGEFGYKLSRAYGYWELVDEGGNVITKKGVEGELVGTNLDNEAMPLVRYKTGDFTQYIDYSRGIVAPISGKWNGKYLLGKSNEKITLTALNIHSEELNFIEIIQFIQEKPGHVHINYSASKKVNTLPIEQLLTKRVGFTISFVFNEEGEFIRSHRGKIPLLVSRIV